MYTSTPGYGSKNMCKCTHRPQVPRNELCYPDIVSKHVKHDADVECRYLIREDTMYSKVLAEN